VGGGPAGSRAGGAGRGGRALAELLVERDPAGAAEACALALAVDPYHDPLWRLLVEARERAGDPAAATSARSGYSRMLAELGLAPSTGGDESGGLSPGSRRGRRARPGRFPKNSTSAMATGAFGFSDR